MNLNSYTNKQLFKDLWAFIAPYKKQFWLGTIIRVISDVIWLFPVWGLAEIITIASNYAENGGEITRAWWILGIIGIVGLIHFIFHDLCKYYVYQVAEKSSIDAFKKTLRHLFSLDFAWHETERTGNKMQRIIKARESINNLVRIWVDLVMESSVNIIAIIFILAQLDILFAVFLVFFFVSYYILSYILTARAVKQSHKVNLEWETFHGTSFESINNITLIKSMHIAPQILPYLAQTAEILVEKIKKRIYFYRTRNGSLNLYQEIFRLGLIAYTLAQVFNGNLEVGVIAMVLLYFGKIEAAAYEFSLSYNQFVTAKVAIMRMRQILDLKPTIEKQGNLNLQENWQNLHLKNINFAYKGQHVLKDFSLSIKNGEKIGLVGISGTGKSTLFKLLLQLYNDYSGEITFDETNLKTLNRENYIKNIAVVPQETELFHLSLRDNILMATEQNDEEKLKKALQIAHVNDFLYKLPHGVNSFVGEKGIRLSGGERQRVGIARAVYKAPKILLLDEATSHLDTISEQKIQEALHDFFQGITAIVIAHRLSTLKEMDRIVVMDKGKVIEIGTFQELLKNKGAFAQLWEKQKIG